MFFCFSSDYITYWKSVNPCLQDVLFSVCSGCWHFLGFAVFGLLYVKTVYFFYAAESVVAAPSRLCWFPVSHSKTEKMWMKWAQLFALSSFSIVFGPLLKALEHVLTSIKHTGSEKSCWRFDRVVGTVVKFPDERQQVLNL